MNGDWDKPSLGGTVEAVAIYGRVLNETEMADLRASVCPQGKALNPNPSDGATYVPPHVVLNWTAGESTTSHDVYFGTSETAVANATTASDEYMGNQAENTYDPPGRLKMGKIYYWRIDEVNPGDPESPWIGSVWSFTTNDGKASNPGPAHGAQRVPTDVILTWTPGLLATSHDVYFGTDEYAVSNASRPIGDIDGSGLVDLADMSVLAEWWLQDPAGSQPNVDLSDDDNVNMIDYTVLAGDWQEQADAAFKGNVTDNRFNPGILQEDINYYWRVDAVNGADIWKGKVWSFDTSSAPEPGRDVVVHAERGRFCGSEFFWGGNSHQTRRFSNQTRKFSQEEWKKCAKIDKSLQKLVLFEQKLAEIHAFWTTFWWVPAQMIAPGARIW